MKNFDYVSYLSKDVLDRFIGKYNITGTTLAALETSMMALLESLKLASVAKIGAPVIDYKMGSITQNSLQRDKVEIMINVEFPYALNMIGLHLISSDL
jgi:hypothetical protein